MNKYYIEYTVTLKIKKSEYTQLNAFSKREAKKILKAQEKEEYGDDLLRIEVNDIYQTSDDLPF